MVGCCVGRESGASMMTSARFAPKTPCFVCTPRSNPVPCFDCPSHVPRGLQANTPCFEWGTVKLEHVLWLALLTLGCLALLQLVGAPAHTGREDTHDDTHLLVGLSLRPLPS